MGHKIARDYGLNRTGGRSLFEIIRDYLSYCKTPRMYSRAIAKNNLQNDRGRPITDWLIGEGLLEQIQIPISMKSKIKATYLQTTDRGLRFVSAFDIALGYLGIQYD